LTDYLHFLEDEVHFRSIHFKALTAKKILFSAVLLILLCLAYTTLKDPLQRYLFGVKRDVCFMNIPLAGKLEPEVEFFVRQAAKIYYFYPSSAVFIPETKEVIPELNGCYIDVQKTVVKIMQAPPGSNIKPVYVETRPLLTLNDYPASPIYQGHPAKKQIALMFSVSCSSTDKYIEDLLDVLARENIRATFFLTGKWAEENPEYVNLIFNHGHELGNHGYQEDIAITGLKGAEMQGDIVKTNALLFRLAGVKAVNFTPNHGEYNDLLLEAVSRLGMRTVLWSVNTADWQTAELKKIADTVRESLGNGKIIRIQPTEQPAAFLAELIAILQDEGYELTSVEELLSPSPFSSEGRLIVE
jgi:peptidoglycan/xylan/chitin deacetylase (PgdA/CDA1 family)